MCIFSLGWTVLWRAPHTERICLLLRMGGGASWEQTREVGSATGLLKWFSHSGFPFVTSLYNLPFCHTENLMNNNHKGSCCKYPTFQLTFWFVIWLGRQNTRIPMSPGICCYGENAWVRVMVNSRTEAVGFGWTWPTNEKWNDLNCR